MDVAMSVSTLKSLELANQIQYAVAGKVMSVTRDQGAAIIQLLQSAMKGFEEEMANANARTDRARLLDVYG